MHRHPGNLCLCSIYVLTGQTIPFPSSANFISEQERPSVWILDLWSLPFLAAAGKETVEGKGNAAWWEGRIYP